MDYDEIIATFEDALLQLNLNFATYCKINSDLGIALCQEVERIGRLDQSLDGIKVQKRDAYGAISYRIEDREGLTMGILLPSSKKDFSLILIFARIKRLAAVLKKMAEEEANFNGTGSEREGDDDLK